MCLDKFGYSWDWLLFNRDMLWNTRLSLKGVWGLEIWMKLGVEILKIWFLGKNRQHESTHKGYASTHVVLKWRDRTWNTAWVDTCCLWVDTCCFCIDSCCFESTHVVLFWKNRKCKAVWVDTCDFCIDTCCLFGSIHTVLYRYILC